MLTLKQNLHLLHFQHTAPNFTFNLTLSTTTSYLIKWMRKGGNTQHEPMLILKIEFIVCTFKYCNYNYSIHTPCAVTFARYIDHSAFSAVIRTAASSEQVCSTD